MKTILRILAVVLALVVLLVAGGIGVLKFGFPKKRATVAAPIDRTAERLARGKYLVHHVADCLGCHSDHLYDRWAMPVRPGTEGQGGFVFDAKLGIPGVVAAQNITPDRETGLGAWSDDEIARAIREGVDREGEPLFPMMPYESFRSMSDEDVASIVAYLRTLPPVKNLVPPRKIDFPVNLFIRLAPEPIATPVATPDDTKDHLGYGRYLVTIGGCTECHTPHDEKNQPIREKALSGGWLMAGPWGRVVTANLTPHPQTFVGRATKEEFVGRFKAFESMNASSAPIAPKGQNTVMPWLAFAGMTEQDLGAIYDYLRSLPPVDHPVDPFPDRQATQ